MNVVAPAWSPAELDVLRGVLAFAWLWSLDSLLRAERRDSLSHPQGWARWVPLRWAEHRHLRRVLPAVTWAAVIAYVLGRATIPALIVLGLVVVVEVTRDNSAGGGGHRHHLLATVTVVQLAAHAAFAVVGAGEHSLFLQSADATAAWWTVQSIVAVYFVSGLEKLLRTGGLWVHRSPGLLVRALSVRTAHQMAAGARKRRAARRAEHAVRWLADHPGLTRLVFGAGLAVELAAPVGLLDEGLLLAVGVLLLALHAANGYLLGLAFAHWQLLVLAFLVNPGRLLG